METRRNSPISSNYEEDRISKLPDSLVHHILSFVELKDAVQTCILSKEWRYKWTTLPTLYFKDFEFIRAERDRDDTLPEEKQAFIDFVNGVLDHRKRDIHIQSFRLVCDTMDDEIMSGYITKWICIAVRCRVKELYLRRSVFGHNFEIPRCVFTCESLTKLEIEVCIEYEEDNVVLPAVSVVSLPRLKYLRLEYLQFDDERLTNMIFSGCPALETLILDCCNFIDMNLTISSLTLEHFHLNSPNFYQTDRKVKLCAPNLTSFFCRDFMFKEYSLEDLSSLVSADISIRIADEDSIPGKDEELRPEMKELYARRVMKYMRALHNVKELKLHPLFLEVVSRGPEILDNQATQFLNLKLLKMGTWLSRDCMDSIFYLLKISPNLESLVLYLNKKDFYKPPIYPVIDEIKFDSRNTEDYWEVGLFSQCCLLYHLKFVEIIYVEGCVNELKFLEILLKNAMVLEKLSLFCYFREQSPRHGRMLKFREKLLSFPRASANVTISFKFR